jgi:hypothetical protein
MAGVASLKPSSVGRLYVKNQKKSICCRYDATVLFDLGFFEFNMLSYDRVVFFKYELFCLGARIFLRDIEKTRVGR